MRVTNTRRPRALVAGGSVGGMFAALLLHRTGWEVDIFERIGADLSTRGAGIVTHPELFNILDAAGIDRKAASIGVAVTGRRIFGLDGSIVGELDLPQVLTSWGTLYKLLREALPVGSYHAERNVVSVVESPGSVGVVLSNGQTEEGDLLIGADGLFSTVRQQFRPAWMPTYVGYIAWRGLVEEAALTEKTRDALCRSFSFSLPVGEQMLGYPVASADGELEVGKRRYNFVWYRPAAEGDQLSALLTDIEGVSHPLSIPPHMIRPQVVADMRNSASALLAPQFAEVVRQTEQPFIQAIQDLEVESMRLGERTIILGDAAFVARPHVGMGVTKAAGDAWALARALRRYGENLSAALDEFDVQRSAFGAAVIRRARHLGAYMQAQALTDEERLMAEKHRRPEAIMAETAVATGIAA
ncbi:FAD-dependent oxidoreductase [Rhizobium sullae]|uniref:FAD-dependent oxidoreductase n=1 Tax=Rhizobium sullae TaxID=50338 RepID=A0A2N0D070_RHISU|nr:FAD binding domain-containing protein [Rhizobium sullae]PKA39510.1 FAD-dependent oxidoreductase [Rhizobium sullae]